MKNIGMHQHVAFGGDHSESNGLHETDDTISLVDIPNDIERGHSSQYGI